MLIGYARALIGEDIEEQRDRLTAAGCSTIHVDRCAAHDRLRPSLNRALASAVRGDVIVFVKMDRIAQSLPQLIELIALMAARDIGFQTLDGDLDTSGPNGRAILRTFACLAELQRDLTKERSIADVISAQNRRVRNNRGRASEMSKEKLFAAIEMLADRKLPGKEVAAQLGISLPNLYSYVDPKGNPRDKGRKILTPKLTSPNR